MQLSRQFADCHDQLGTGWIVHRLVLNDVDTVLSVLVCVVKQESGLKVNQPASFAVSLNGAKGVIDAKVHSPSGALEECCVTEIDQGNHRNGNQTHLHNS